MTMSVSTDFLPKTVSGAYKILYIALMGVFFLLPSGTSPPTIMAGITAGIWLFSGIAFKTMPGIAAEKWFWPLSVIIILPWVGLLYTVDTAGIGMDYAEKTHYWIYGFAVASVCAVSIPPKKMIDAFLVGLAINAVIGVFQFAGLIPAQIIHLQDGGIGYEYRGLGLGYNTLSPYLIVGILMLSFYFRNTVDKKERLYYAACMCLFFFHLIVLKGRTGYFTFIVLSPVIVYNMLKGFSIYKIMLICALILGFMSFSPVVQERVALSIDELKYHIHADPEAAWGREYTTKQDRFYMWYGAVQLIKDNPFFGVGTGGYQTALHNKAKPGWPVISHPHNNYLYIAVSFGMIGLFIYFWFFFTILKNGWKGRKTTHGFFILSTTLVILVSGFMNTPILDSGTAFLFALAVGLQAAVSTKAAKSRRSTGK